MDPEVDLSTFMEKQRISEASGLLALPLENQNDDDDDVDHTLAHISSHRTTAAPSKKGKVSQIKWDDELDELSREKASAEATWGEKFSCVVWRKDMRLIPREKT